MHLMFLDIDGLLPNVKCVDSTPDFIIMKVVTDLNKVCKYYFGQEVITRKTGGKQIVPNSRNEYGIVVGLGNVRTGSTLVYLPNRSGMFGNTQERLWVKPIMLNDRKTLNMDNGRQILPIINGDGSIIFQSAKDIDNLQNINNDDGENMENNIGRNNNC